MKFLIAIGAIVAVIVGGIILLPKTSTLNTSSLQTLNNMVGKPAPSFTLASLHNQQFTLTRERGHVVVLFFSEGIMCYPACWNQIAALGNDSKLNNSEVTAVSIVPDSASDWSSAIRKEPDLAKADILLDSNLAVARQYSMLNLPSSMHKGMKPGHTYVVIDKNGIVRYVKDDPNMGNNDSLLEREVAKYEK